jgi:hypothetical protein
MKLFAATAALAALLAIGGAASAQSFPVVPPPPGPPALPALLPPWMQDDGSSSDHPIHMRSDFSGDRLNYEYRDGLPVIGAATPGPDFSPR